ncbi:hypothetical protein HNP86_001764 [Methanococcus maripaludis]|uniref:Uncharacterized protein n=1 Tax=Methanococcus maripaludis TaxID=39152 RepID=A0A7J9NWG7_METMI|nr:hypothetical protein [Methanococcus maripaludis]MBA2851605.1 hypothetical protein [Methanococcus maripaludis]
MDENYFVFVDYETPPEYKDGWSKARYYTVTCPEGRYDIYDVYAENTPEQGILNVHIDDLGRSEFNQALHETLINDDYDVLVSVVGHGEITGVITINGYPYCIGNNGRSFGEFHHRITHVLVVNGNLLYLTDSNRIISKFNETVPINEYIVCGMDIYTIDDNLQKYKLPIGKFDYMMAMDEIFHVPGAVTIAIEDVYNSKGLNLTPISEYKQQPVKLGKRVTIKKTKKTTHTNAPIYDFTCEEGTYGAVIHTLPDANFSKYTRNGELDLPHTAWHALLVDDESIVNRAFIIGEPRGDGNQAYIMINGYPYRNPYVDKSYDATMVYITPDGDCLFGNSDILYTAFDKRVSIDEYVITHRHFYKLLDDFSSMEMINTPTRAAVIKDILSRLKRKQVCEFYLDLMTM